MEKEQFTDDLRRFILTSVPSVPYLEAILLMRGDPSTRWDAAKVAARLYVPQAHAAALLQALQAAGIATDDGARGTGHRYQPAQQLDQLLDRIARLYSTDLLAVTELIHSRIDKRAQQFGDAFRWRKAP